MVATFEAELGGRLAQRLARRAAVLVIVVHVEQGAVRLRQRQVLADFGRRLGERLHHLEA